MVDADGIIRIPYCPREQFIPFHNRTQRRACIVSHRGAGKTLASIHDLQRAALSNASARSRFAYVAPTRVQAKQVAWDYLREACAPLAELGVTVHESELRVDYHNGGQVRLHGADNPDAARGLHLDGVVLDEYADWDPRAWSEVLSPALAVRNGFAVFIGTPKGKNNFWDIWNTAQNNPAWYSLMLKASETGLLSKEQLAEQRASKSEDQYEQEYECSFTAAIQGAYYGKLMAQAEADKRICGTPHDPAAKVWTAWDLGIGDSTAIWFCQLIGREIHLIDYYESSGAGLEHYIRQLDSKPYLYAGHILPHDAKQLLQDEQGRTRIEILTSLGLKNLEVLSQSAVEDGIAATRMIIPRCWFDGVKCARGIEALKQYRTDYDEKLKIFKSRPLHDWSSHGADALRYLAKGIDLITPRSKKPIVYPRLGIV